MGDIEVKKDQNVEIEEKPKAKEKPKDPNAISIRVAPKENFILKEILSRVSEKKRSEFVREAIFYWDYILNHSNIGSRLITTDKSKKQVIDNLFPKSYFIKRQDPDMSIKEKFDTVEIKAIRFDIGSDEVDLQEICKRAVSLDDFVKEAIFEWDCLLNTSNVFLSRFIKRKDNSSPEWHALNLGVENTSNKVENSTTNNINTQEQGIDNKQSTVETTFNNIKNSNITETTNNVEIKTEQTQTTPQIEPDKDTKISVKQTGMSVGRKNKLKF